MSNQTLSILQKAANPTKSKYNIVTFDTHERYQTMMARTGHNFYSFQYDDCKTWVDAYGKKPANYYTLPKNALVNGIDFDFILSQSKFGQFQFAKQMQQVFKIPLISLEHTLPIPSWPEQQLKEMRAMTGDQNVFISKFSARRWGIFPHTVIKHCVDTEQFSPGEEERANVALSVVNDYKARDYCCNYQGWERITKDLPVKLVGSSPEPEFSKAAESIDELTMAYRRSSIFLNTSTVSPVPTSLLEAMACGCAVVTTATCMIPEIIKNGENGFISNDETELRDKIQLLLNDPELARKLGEQARQTVVRDFGVDVFVNNWNAVFDTAYGAKR
jgi:glycosyltransferase involved in cell wall biosynthesis